MEQSLWLVTWNSEALPLRAALGQLAKLAQHASAVGGLGGRGSGPGQSHFGSSNSAAQISGN